MYNSTCIYITFDNVMSGIIKKLTAAASFSALFGIAGCNNGGDNPNGPAVLKTTDIDNVTHYIVEKRAGEDAIGAGLATNSVHDQCVGEALAPFFEKTAEGVNFTALTSAFCTNSPESGNTSLTIADCRIAKGMKVLCEAETLDLKTP